VQTIRFKVNGLDYSLTVEPLKRLLDVLRDDLRLTSVKESCGEGECGSCTVLLEDKPVLACLMPVIQIEGREVTTVEGLQDDALYQDLELALSETGAVQCGFCTPGIIMSSWSWLAGGGSTGREEIKQALAGNLCRCTGYQKIVDGVVLAAERINDRSSSGGQS
jgi:aerobic-type carbon monoxide dehydrogenase small subunit (CoxS/CutS family)